MKFKLEIEIGNDAMLDYDDLARVLHRVASSLRGMGKPNINDFDPIRDDNGNTVGQLQFEESEE